MTALQTIIVEPNCVVREGLKQVLKNGGYDVFAAVDQVAALRDITAFPESVTVVLSARAGDQVDGVRAIKAVSKAAQIVVIGAPSSMQATLCAIQTGANACLDDSASTEVFFKSLDLAAHGLAAISLSGMTTQSSCEIFEPSSIPAPVSNSAAEAGATPLADANGRSGAPAFSPREAAILQLLQEGAPNKLIARQLSLTEATVKVHLKSILRKIRVKNRTQAAVWAMSQDTFAPVAGDKGWDQRSAGLYDEPVSAKN